MADKIRGLFDPPPPKPWSIQSKAGQVFNGLEYVDVTPVEYCKREKFWLKREDYAGKTSENHPSGAKVRQFCGMISKAKPGTPMVVGCSASAAMQIYLADAARTHNVPAYVFVPQRAETTLATQWAIQMGAVVTFVSPGYPSVYHFAAKKKIAELGSAIRWDVSLAITDAAAQTINIPSKVKRIVIPTGSGLVTAGVLLGLSSQNRTDIEVRCIAPKGGMARQDKILKLCQRLSGEKKLPPLTLCIHPKKYEVPVKAELPDGTPLDPYYAAKAFGCIVKGDCLWITGSRPVELIKRELIWQ